LSFRQDDLIVLTDVRTGKGASASQSVHLSEILGEASRLLIQPAPGETERQSTLAASRWRGRFEPWDRPTPQGSLIQCGAGFPAAA